MTQPQGLQRVRQPITGTAKAFQVQFCPSEQGQLAIKRRGGAFPEGALLLLISNWLETEHWCVPARQQGERLEATLAGIDALFDGAEAKPFLLSLAKREGEGLVRYPLRGRRFLSRLQEKNRCPYLVNDRRLWGRPVACFRHGGDWYEALPRFTGVGRRQVGLCLSILPRTLRYWRQLCYGVNAMELRDGQWLVSIVPPRQGPALEGVAIHRADGSEDGAQVFPVAREDSPFDARALPRVRFAGGGRPVWAAIDLAKLPMDGEEYALSAVVSNEGDVPRYAPLALVTAEVHQRAQDMANGVPLRREGEWGCFLSVNGRCVLRLRAGTHPAFWQEGITAPSLQSALEEGTLGVSGTLGVQDLGGQDLQWRFFLPNLRLEPEAELLLQVHQTGGSLTFPVERVSTGEGGSLLQADLSRLAEQTASSLLTRRRLTLCIRQGTRFANAALCIPARTLRPKLNDEPMYQNTLFCYGAPFGVIPLGETAVEALICCLAGGGCYLQLSDRLRRYDKQIVCRAEQCQVRRGRLRVRARCPDAVPGRWESFALVYRHKREADRRILFLPAGEVVQKEGYTWMSADVPLRRYTLSPLYWDIQAVFRGEDGQPYLVRLHSYSTAPRYVTRSVGGSLLRTEKRLKQKGGRLAAQANRFLHTNSYRQGGAGEAGRLRWGKKRDRVFSDSYDENAGLSVSLYQTRDLCWALVCQAASPYSGPVFRMKERLALLLYRIFRKRLEEKHIFLCYEKYCCMAQDNGFYFFRYCMEAGMEQKLGRSIYYVIDKAQSDYRERLLPYREHVIQFMSLKHMVYVLAAQLLIASDSKAHVYAWRAKESIILPRIQRRKKLVFLQHGVIALKQVPVYRRTGVASADLFVSSNQREHDIISEKLGYPPENVIITGLARWDVLLDKGLEEQHILLMPTWRSWLEEVTEDLFAQSDYYRSYMALLNDPGTEALLERRDLYLDFYIHPKFRDYLSRFSVEASPRVRLIPFGMEPLNQLIMGCKMLVTDYSSVCWDVYYQKKPVLFYQFDVEQYLETTGSYIDFETELFGERVRTPGALLAKLEEYAENGFRLPRPYEEMHGQMFAYHDQNNSRRICEEIMKRGW